MSAAARKLLRDATAQSVTEAYDRAHDAMREVQRISPALASQVRTARDLLFSVRVKLENDE